MATTTTNFGWDIPQSTDLVKDGATAIAALGQDIDTAFVDLKGGTTGQILAKASNTDLDYSWITNDVGDITAVTAGTGISGGGTSGAVTITNSMATEISAKGDLIVGTGSQTFDNLTAGANDYFLQAASGETTGLKWGGAWTTYTPTVTAQSGSITSYSSQGAYIKIGKMVSFYARTAITNAGTGSLSLQISLPATAKTGEIYTFSGQETSTTGKGLTGSFGAATNDYGKAWVRFYDWTSCIVGGYTIAISGTYEVA